MASAAIPQAAAFLFGPFRLEPAERLLQRNGKAVALTPKVFDLLCLLVETHGHVLSKEEIMKRLWPDTIVEEANLVQNISVLRRALGHATGNEYIETVPRFGYRFVAPVRRSGDAESGLASRAPHPETRYARSGDVNIAYQVLGSGPIDLVFVMGWVSHLEYFWAEPSFARFLQRLATFARLILFDKRGTGLSDSVPLTALPTLEQRMDDVRAVMEAVGSERAVLMGVSEGGPMSALFAATYPEKTAALIMIGTYAKRLRDESYPWGPSAEERAAYLRQIRDEWGGPIGIEERAPSKAVDPAFREWWATYLRRGASPGAAIALTQMNAEIDVRPVLPLVRVPSLVIHRQGDQCLKVQEGRFVASLIPGARFVALPGSDHLPFVGEQDEILDTVQQFLAETRGREVDERVLGTILSLDVDAPVAGREAIRREIQWFRGREFEGGRFFGAIFDGPARAIRCASAIVAAARQSGISARAGVHTGECDCWGTSRVRGPAVELAEQIALMANPGEVLVSSTVKDLVAGSGLTLAEMACPPIAHPDGQWRLFRATSA